MQDAPERGGALQLADFGFSRVQAGAAAASDGDAAALAAAAAAAASMSAGGRRGTSRYMAPELFAQPAPGARPARPSYRSDVYAWGVLAWQVGVR